MKRLWVGFYDMFEGDVEDPFRKPPRSSFKEEALDLLKIGGLLVFIFVMSSLFM